MNEDDERCLHTEVRRGKEMRCLKVLNKTIHLRARGGSLVKNMQHSFTGPKFNCSAYNVPLLWWLARGHPPLASV